MKIAVPLVDCKLAHQLGHCTSFAFFDIDPDKKELLRRQDLPAPPHQPDLLPTWLAEHGVNMVIANGMGKRAMELLNQKKIGFIVGAEKDAPEILIADHLRDNLQLGDNPCDSCYTVSIKLPKK